MAKQMQFESREAFRSWLEENCLSEEGIWLVFGKDGGTKTLTAGEALEEALCFGWIDSQIKSIDDKSYIKYFAQRSKKTEWSAKNIALVEELEVSGRMTDYGRAKIEEAKQNNCFKAKSRPQITEELIEQFTSEIKDIEPAYSNFLTMSASVKRTYTGLYFETKSEQTRKNRLNKIIDRL
ncbi:MAG: YdeI/OmpD-associated family protein, partial [Bacillota bacterium]|nr:YdeI/OmpD-associated family protein [Bacillota bacterium]